MWIGCSPCTQEVEGSTPTGGTYRNDFFRSNRPGYPHPVSSELENSAIRVAVGDCSVTERRWWRPPYQTGKTVHMHAKHYKHNEDGRTAPGVCGNGSVPLSHSGNVVTRTGIHTLLSFFYRRKMRAFLRKGTLSRCSVDVLRHANKLAIFRKVQGLCYGLRGHHLHRKK